MGGFRGHCEGMGRKPDYRLHTNCQLQPPARFINTQPAVQRSMHHHLVSGPQLALEQASRQERGLLPELFGLNRDPDSTVAISGP